MDAEEKDKRAFIYGLTFRHGYESIEDNCRGKMTFHISMFSSVIFSHAKVNVVFCEKASSVC